MSLNVAIILFALSLESFKWRTRRRLPWFAYRMVGMKDCVAICKRRLYPSLKPLLAYPPRLLFRDLMDAASNASCTVNVAPACLLQSNGYCYYAGAKGLGPLDARCQRRRISPQSSTMLTLSLITIFVVSSSLVLRYCQPASCSSETVKRLRDRVVPPSSIRLSPLPPQETHLRLQRLMLRSIPH